MKRTALLMATLLAGLVAAPAIQASPLTFFQQLFQVGSAEDRTHDPRQAGPFMKGPCFGSGCSDSTSNISTEAEGSGRGYGRGYGYGDGYGRGYGDGYGN